MRFHFHLPQSIIKKGNVNIFKIKGEQTELTGVLLSIKPKYVKAIMDGSKEYEFRKQIFKNRSVKTAYIYASSPMKKIVGCFYLSEIVEGHPDLLWEKFWDVSGVSEEEFFEYFAGKENGFAIHINSLESFGTPIDPRELYDNFVPPQSFCYFDRLIEFDLNVK